MLRELKVGLCVIGCVLLFSAWATAATTLTFLGYHPTQQQIDELAVKRFMADHPGVKVDMVMQPEDYIEKVLAMIATGVAPDVVVRDIGGTYLEWWLDGLLLDLTPYVERNAAHFKDWIPEFANRGKIGGRYVAIARQMAGVYVNWFNRKLFDGAGLSYPDISWTWDTFRDTMRKLTVDKNGDGVPDQYGYHHSWKSWQPFLYDNGGGILGASDATQFLFDSPRTVEALEYLQELEFSYGVLAPNHNFTGGRADRAFYDGRAAMMLRSLSALGNMPAHMKDGTTLGIAMAPLGKGIRHTMSVVGGFAIPKESKHHDLAFELIKYLTDAQAQRDGKAISQGLVTNHRINMESFPHQVPVLNYDQMLVQAISQPMFNAATETPERVNTLIEELISTTLVKNEMPVKAAMEKYLPLIKQDIEPFIAKLKATTR